MYIGKSIQRGEDRRFVTGRGRFTDDIEFPGALHAAFVRSPHGHAKLAAIDSQAALEQPGVVAVLSAKDWQAAGMGVLPSIVDIPPPDGASAGAMFRPVFAAEEVKHVGDTVAVVLAEDANLALDAAETVTVDYEPLEAVVRIQDALSATSPMAHSGTPSNLVHRLEVGDIAATKRVFDGAPHVTRVAFEHPRVAGNAIEPRAYAAKFDSIDDRYTLLATGQNPHFLRRVLATHALHIPITALRVVCPDVGGGFGPKFYCYPEQAIVLWASRLFGRPVRWTATRTDSLLTDTHARDHYVEAELALDENGHILAIRADVVATYGAYQSTYAPIIVMQSVPGTLPGMYRVPVGSSRTTGVYTNATPIDAYRGTKQLAALIHEFLIDKAARELRIDPLQIRLRNYLDKNDYPHKHVFGTTYDSGDPARQHDTLSSLVDYTGLRVEQARGRGDGLRLGIGVAAVVESTGLGPSQQIAAPGLGIGGWEAARVTLHPDGKADIVVGTHAHGQSHEITFRQIAADRLGIDLQDVRFFQGDTDLGPGNMGTAAARSLSTAGVGVAEGCARVIEKSTRLAAHLLECSADDVSYENGDFTIAGTDRVLSLTEIAHAAYSGASYPRGELELGLEETVYFDPVAFSYPTALHLVSVLVDIDTGVVRLRDYSTVDDCGRVINPMVVHGQVHGGIAQGVGQALMEQMVLDPASGQVLSGSFMDYAMPRADDFPSFKVAFQETLNPNNELGVKGCSETGIVGAPIAIGNALLDALWPLGVRHIEMPYTPETVWRAVRDAARLA